VYQLVADQTAAITLSHNFTVTSTMQTFSSSLDTWTVSTKSTDGSVADLQTAVGNGTLTGGYFQLQTDGSGFSSGPDKILSMDNITVSAPVPEPASLGLIGTGALALLARRKACKA
jgi:hypothetical protein